MLWELFLNQVEQKFRLKVLLANKRSQKCYVASKQFLLCHKQQHKPKFKHKFTVCMFLHFQQMYDIISNKSMPKEALQMCMYVWMYEKDNVLWTMRH